MRAWLTAEEIAEAALPGVPTSARGVTRKATEHAWRDARNAAGEPLARRVGGKRGGGWEYHYTLLPSPAQAMLAAEAEAPALPAGPGPKRAKAGASDRDQMWARYDALPQKAKDTARDRAEALDAVLLLELGNMTRSAAVGLVAARWDVAARSIFRWLADVEGVAREDWLAWLAPRYVGRMVRAECPPEAWELLKADWLRPAQPSFAACYWRISRLAEERGWNLPSMRTLANRMDAEIPVEVQVLAREGVEALKRRFPAQERDRSGFHALEAVNADGHKFDVFVRWPGEAKPVRVVMVAIQDLYSGMILGWRIDRSESAELVRLVIGDVVQRYGIFSKIWLDNGRAFASKWLTGQMPFRYRFKIRNEEPQGILLTLGVEVHWATPYHGQAKPIERAFKDLCETIAKHPAFEGAYTGNAPDAKPENYGNRAIPLDDFLKVVDQEIRWHNERPGRRSAVCAGQASYREAFDASYTNAPITIATDEQKRLWLLAAENVMAATVDGSITLMGNRYWSHAIGRLSGQRLTVRFDPQNLHEGIHAYTLDGRYIGFAECLAPVGFADVDAARQKARDVGQWVKGHRQMLDAERRMSAADVARQMTQIGEPEVPEARLVRARFAAPAASRPAPAEPADDLWNDPEMRGRILQWQAAEERRRA